MNNPFINHYYINLEERKDRNKNAINELSKLGVHPNRFNAIKTDIGIVGCGLSHFRVIQEAKKKDLPYVCIFEDDVVIKNPDLLIRKVNKLINKNFDVLLLGGNNFKPYEDRDEYNGDYIKVSRCYTNTAYIVKNHYYDTILENLNEGIVKLCQTNNRNYSLDAYSHILQRRDNWFLITPICIYQKEGYSDIENKNVNYKSLMLNYDK